MKDDKINKAMEHLAIALNLIPQESNLAEERKAIRNILSRIETAQKKRVKSKDIQRKVSEDYADKVKSWVSNAINPKASLEALDKMLEDEKKNLAMIQSKNSGKEETLLG